MFLVSFDKVAVIICMGNAIIIDGEVIWYGDINPFKENIYDDSIMRIDDEVYAKELILEVKNQ